MRDANQRRNDDPDLRGLSSGDGDPRSGPGSRGREPAPILYEPRPQECKIFVNQVRLWLTDDVALQRENVSSCFLLPKAYRPNLQTLSQRGPGPPSETPRRRWRLFIFVSNAFLAWLLEPNGDHLPHRWSDNAGEVGAEQIKTRNEKPPSH